MEMNGVIVVQMVDRSNTGAVLNYYYLYTPTNIQLGVISLPPNGQYMLDAKALNIITRAIAARWNA